MESLERDFLPQFCTIMQPVSSRNSLGEDVPSWVERYTGIPCRVSAGYGSEIRTNEMKYLDATHVILMTGTYNGLNETMRAKVDGQVYEIAKVNVSAEMATTQLMARVVR
jgi:head-tail adaptor